MTPGDRKGLSATAVVDSDQAERPRAGRRDPDALVEGMLVGRYAIREVLGGGAMGVVYAAHDPELDRRVAIKLVRAGMCESQGRARLLREAQALARLSHPSVVAVFDAGTFRGEVFVAMELIDGVTLAEWLRAAPRAWREVVAVFLRAGAGLAAAHEAGLVHRDFKPTNVLLDRAAPGRLPRVRVVDFGLARATGIDPERPPLDADAAEDATLTREGAIVGTPIYMSPEQHAGKPADARSDQFAFCVSLWEALYGARPFAGDTQQALARATSQGDLQPPPRAARVPGRVRALLERGLAPDPERRFPSMAALLVELERDPGARARRAAGVIAVTGMAVLAAVGYARRDVCGGGAARLAGVWDPDRRAAVAEAFRRTGRPYAGDALRAVGAAIDGFAARWLERHRDACEATRVRGEQSAELLDLRMACLDQHLRGLAVTTELLAGADAALVERAAQSVPGPGVLDDCDDADALRGPKRPPPDPAQRAAVEALRATLGRAFALQHAGQYPAALALAEDVVQRARTIAYRPVEAEAALRHADLLERNGDGKAAERRWRDAIRLAEASQHHRVRAEALVQLVWTQTKLGKLADADERAADARAVLDGRGPEPDLQVMLERHLGTLRREQGKLDEALAHHRRGLELASRVAGPDSLPALGMLDALSQLLYESGRHDEALANMERVVAGYQVAYGPSHPRTALAMSNHGSVLQDLGKHREAQARHAAAVAILEKALPAGHPSLAVALNNLGGAQYLLGELRAARASYTRALEIREAALGKDHPDVATTLTNLSGLEADLGRPAAGLELAARAAAIFERALGPEHPDLAIALDNHGSALARAGRRKEAHAAHTRALAIAERALGPKSPVLAPTLTALGDNLVDLGQPAAAVPALERALAVADAAATRERGQARFALARALTALGRDPARARALARDAVRDLEASGPLGQELLARARSWLAAHP